MLVSVYKCCRVCIWIMHMCMNMCMSFLDVVYSSVYMYMGATRPHL